MECKVATWNLCLGLSNKKNIVKETILAESIDICCMQETELPNGYPANLLSFPGYSIEVEINDIKSRVAVYISDKISYKRRNDLEGTNSNIIVIDLLQENTRRLINVYRSFNPQEGVNQRTKFKYQLELIKKAMSKNTVLLGDFNIDDCKRYSIDYPLKELFMDFDDALAVFGLIQLVKFKTWSRLINNTLKSSVLDHIYTTDFTNISNLKSIKPTFGDHLLIYFDFDAVKTLPKESLRRDWRQYSAEKLCNELSKLDFNIGICDVQEYWNVFENMIINVIDVLIPLATFTNNTVKNSGPPKAIKNCLNKRQRLLKRFKQLPCIELKTKINELDREIRLHFKNEKRTKVRKGIIPGNTRSLWKAVNLAKDINTSPIPDILHLNGNPIPMRDISDVFAGYFDSKIQSIVNETAIKVDVYNGKCKVVSREKMFMSPSNVFECIKSIKVKNCEGHDRIPQRVLFDGADHLTAPLAELFSRIYTQNKIPQQWLIAKVNPIHKKGNKNDIENYRPISNLCSTSKIFEKLILRRVLEIEDENKADLTGVEQHGFKKAKSTATAGLILQSILSRALDSNNYALMASIDLSAAFDLVNIKLLMKRLKVIGLPNDILRLIELWLSKRSFYVSLNGMNSMVIDLNCGTIQGSILGPLLYAIYVSPLFDLINLTNFADDNFVIRWNKCLEALIIDMKKELEVMTKWLKDSGLKVNESKTEICLFHRLDCRQVCLNINQTIITSLPSMNVLGVSFDSKLNWSCHINTCVKKARNALHAIKLIKPYFTPKELSQLVTSNFYSILYYNSEIWHLPNLNPLLKRHLLAASASALKLCTPGYNNFISYLDLHQINSRATPNQMMKYKHSVLLFKVYNDKNPPKDWLTLNFQQVLTRRQEMFEIIRNQNYKIGNNMISNRLSILNKLIPLHWLNLSLSSYKVKCKSIFMPV